MKNAEPTENSLNRLTLVARGLLIYMDSGSHGVWPERRIGVQCRVFQQAASKSIRSSTREQSLLIVYAAASVSIQGKLTDVVECIQCPVCPRILHTQLNLLPYIERVEAVVQFDADVKDEATDLTSDEKRLLKQAIQAELAARRKKR